MRFANRITCPSCPRIAAGGISELAREPLMANASSAKLPLPPPTFAAAENAAARTAAIAGISQTASVPAVDG